MNDERKQRVPDEVEQGAEQDPKPDEPTVDPDPEDDE